MASSKNTRAAAILFLGNGAGALAAAAAGGVALWATAQRTVTVDEGDVVRTMVANGLGRVATVAIAAGVAGFAAEFLVTRSFV